MFFRKATIGISLIGIAILSTISVAYASGASYVVANDTVAGQESHIKATNLAADSGFILSITKPDGTVVKTSTESNSSGEVQYTLSGYHTRVSGEYFVMVSDLRGSQKSNISEFYVYSEKLSEFESNLITNRPVVRADLNDYATVTVIARDKYENLLQGRGVKLFSYRYEDLISPSVALTDKNGRAVFRIKSNLPGIANLVAMDVTEDIILKDRIKVSFVDASKYVAEIGGDYIGIANAAEFGVLDHFEIELLPSTVKKNENVSFTVKAVDSELNIVEDYTGTIRFSSDGDNSSSANLPEDYKFLDTDLGQHQFSLGLSFTEEGTYKIVVNDLNDKFKKGEKTVVVGETVSLGDSDSGEQPQISSPAPGTYSQSVQTISGTAKGGTSVKIFDNNQEIGAVIAGTTGKFSYETSDLEDGTHSIYVVSVDNISNEIIGTSDTVEINIDTSFPKIEDIELDPATGIQPGSVINVKVYSEENLAQAALIFNYDIIELNASIDDPSIYVGTIQAPAELGVYSISVLLVDELQNEQTFEDFTSVTVEAASGDLVAEDTTEEPPLTVEDTELLPKEGLPSEVTGLIAYGSDKRVTLVWDAATDNGLIDNYKVYYGTDVTDLSRVVLTNDASTTWYIPNLNNGEEYFFTVSAIDDEGNESLARSEIVSGIPFVLEINNALSEVPSEPLNQPELHEAAYSGPFPEKTTGTGPEVLLLLAGSAVTGFFVKRKRK